MASQLPCGCPRDGGAERRAGAFSVRRSTYAPSCRLGAHAHAEDRVVLTLESRWFSSYGSRRLAADPQHVVYRPASGEHEDWYAQPTVCLTVVLPPAPRRTDPFGVPDAGFAHAARRICAELDAADASAELVIEGLTAQVVGRVFAVGAPDAGRPRWLRRIRDRLEDEYAAPPSLRTIAASAERSPAHVATTFRRAYGESIGDYLRGVRVWRSAQLLSRGDLGIAEVAQAAGFADQSHFTREFRRRFGTTPGAYRRRTSH
jgi:AraC family transcriptional regulator